MWSSFGATKPRYCVCRSAPKVMTSKKLGHFLRWNCSVNFQSLLKYFDNIIFCWLWCIFCFLIERERCSSRSLSLWGCLIFAARVESACLEYKVFKVLMFERAEATRCTDTLLWVWENHSAKAVSILFLSCVSLFNSDGKVLNNRGNESYKSWFRKHCIIFNCWSSSRAEIYKEIAWAHWALGSEQSRFLRGWELDLSEVDSAFARGMSRLNSNWTDWEMEVGILQRSWNAHYHRKISCWFWRCVLGNKFVWRFCIWLFCDYMLRGEILWPW